MRKISLRLLTVLTLGIVFAEAAHADDWTFYIGGSLGRTKSKEDACVTPELPCDRSNNSSGVQLGVELDQNWAIEAGYKSLSRIVDQNDGAGNWTTVKTKLGEFDLIGMLPIWRFTPYLKAGGYFARNTRDSTIVAPATGNQGGWTYGMGLGYDLTKNIRVRVEWQRYNNVGDSIVGVRTDVETTMLGAVLRF